MVFPTIFLAPSRPSLAMSFQVISLSYSTCPISCVGLGLHPAKESRPRRASEESGTRHMEDLRREDVRSGHMVARETFTVPTFAWISSKCPWLRYTAYGGTQPTAQFVNPENIRRSLSGPLGCI